jgi:nicotinamidase-related amidase
MHGYFYGTKKEIPAEFDDYFGLADTAVVEMDMCRGHLDDSLDCTCPVPRGREIVGAVNAFNKAAREMGVPVVHVHAVNRKDGLDDVRGKSPAAWRRVFPMSFGPIPNSVNHNIEGTKWPDLMVEVKEEDFAVDTKKRLSGFYPTDLDFLLRQLNRSTIVLTGLMTDCCVLNTAFEAANLGYRVIVPRDLTRGFDEEIEEAALRIISLHLGLVMDSSGILQKWEALNLNAAPHDSSAI